MSAGMVSGFTGRKTGGVYVPHTRQQAYLSKDRYPELEDLKEWAVNT
jgi:hypothetical protein